MPDPTRPVAGAPIDTDWGQQVHDATFTPQGCRVAGGASTATGTTYEQLQLNTATDDPGGWLASDSLTVPSGEGGLYLYTLNVSTDNGSVGERTGVQLRVNSLTLVAWFIENNGTTAEFDGRSGLADLSAGDIINVWAKKTGGLDPDVLVREVSFLRVGSEMGRMIGTAATLLVIIAGLFAAAELWQTRARSLAAWGLLVLVLSILADLIP